MRNRNAALSIILIFGVIVMVVVTVLLIKYPDINTKFVIGEEENRDRVVIIDENNYKNNNITYSITHESALDGKIDIEYPVIEGMSDYDLANKINTKLCVNATGILAIHKLKDKINSLDINCTVKEFDNDKITVVYEGELMYNSGNSTTTKKKNTEAYDDYDSNYDSHTTSNYSGGNYNNFGYDPNYDNYGSFQQQNIGGDPNYDNYFSGNNTMTNNITTTNQYDPNAQSSGPQFFNSNNGNAPISNAPANTNLYPGANTLQGFAGTKFEVERIYYTNTVDLLDCKDINLTQYVDESTLASLLKANDKDLIDILASNETEARKYITKQSLSTIKNNLVDADFRNTNLTKWPSCFSYAEDEYIYISYPVSAELGDYVIVRYKY